MKTILFSIFIDVVALLGFVAKILIFIVGTYLFSFLILQGMKGKSDPDFKDLFKFESFVFAFVFLLIFAVIYLCVAFLNSF